MRILVLSDSHSALSFMCYCIDLIKPNAVVHLGDYYDDAMAIEEAYPNIPFYCVPGNCDRHRNVLNAPETRVERVCGVKLFMTHGHLHGVKLGVGSLLRGAEKTDAQAVLYGHTHSAHCERTENGLWILNPGSCGYYGGSAGLITVSDGKISGCRILRQSAMESAF